jgi:hypothetical protein
MKETPYLLLAALLGLSASQAWAEAEVHRRALPVTPQTLAQAVKQGNLDAKESYARQQYPKEKHLGFGGTAFSALFLPATELPGKMRLQSTLHDPHQSKRDRFFVGFSGVRYSQQCWQGQDVAAFSEVCDSRWTFPSSWAAQAYLVQRLPLPESSLSLLGQPVSPDHVLSRPNTYGYASKADGKKAGREWRLLTQHANVVAELVLLAPAASETTHDFAQVTAVFAKVAARLDQAKPSAE